jgi:hypothetical protein
MSLDVVTLIISFFRNGLAKLRLQSLRSSRGINNNVLKLLFLLDLQTVHCRSPAKLEKVTK